MTRTDRHRAPKAMIMAAGMGTRLAPLTDRTAKPMAPIVNRPAMEHILRLLARHGVTEVFVNLHHHADDIQRYFGDGTAFGLRIAYHVESKLMGTAGGVGGFREVLGDGTFVVVSGDALTDIDISDFFAGHRALGGIATLAVKRVDDASHYGVVVHDQDDRIVGFQEKPARGEALSDLCNCGIYAFEPRIFDYIPPGESVDWARDVFPHLLADHTAFHVWRLQTYWNDIGSIRMYRRGNFDALQARVAVEIPGRELRLGVWIGEGTNVADDVVMVPPVLIGNDCHIESGARLIGPLIIGDDCSIGRDAILEGAIHWDGGTTDDRASISGGIVGSGVHVRGGATVHRGAVIGDGCVVKAGAIVKPDARLRPHTVVDRGAAP